MNRNLTISLFENKHDNRPRLQVVTWDQLCELLGTHTVRTSKNGSAWSPTSYLAGSTRANTNVAEVHALVLDLDCGAGPEKFSDLWTGFAHAVYSTHSNTAGYKKFRAVFPLVRPVPAADWPEVVERLSVPLSRSVSDEACKDASRIYFLPAVPAEEQEHSFAFVREGKWLDPDAFAALSLEPSSEEARGRPGDDYNRRASWRDILEPTGAVEVKPNLWVRPGKDPSHGHSARTGLREGDLLYVFSSNWSPFEAHRCYSRFAAYAVLNCGGDFARAASELAKLGFGSRAVAAVPANQPEEKSRETAATKLLDLIDELGVDVFCSTDGTCFASVPLDTRTETLRVDSNAFKNWARRAFFQKHHKGCNDQTLSEACSCLSAEAMYGGTPRRPVHLRVAGDETAIYVDLGSESGEVVEVTSDGWHVIPQSPLHFWRPRGLLPLPRPVQGGSITELRKFVNAGSEEDFMLMVAWLVMSLRPGGQYPILILSGEQGSGKSVTAGVLKRLSDPGSPGTRNLSRDDKDLKAAATNSHVLVFDNLTQVTCHVSDNLCKLSTGGGLSFRANYTDSEESVFEGTRPIIITAIEDVVSKPDLADRSLFPVLPVFERGIKSESTFWQEFEQASGRLFGALLKSLSTALKRLPLVEEPSTLRMADFARFILAAEPALGLNVSFMATYQGNRRRAKEEAAAGSTLASGILELAHKEPWKGTATELVEALAHIVGEIEAKELPKPNALKSKLKTVQPLLRSNGVVISYPPRSGSKRLIVIEKTDAEAVTAVTPSLVKPATVVMAETRSTQDRHPCGLENDDVTAVTTNAADKEEF